MRVPLWLTLAGSRKEEEDDVSRELSWNCHAGDPTSALATHALTPELTSRTLCSFSSALAMGRSSPPPVSGGASRRLARSSTWLGLGLGAWVGLGLGA